MQSRDGIEDVAPLARSGSRERRASSGLRLATVIWYRRKDQTVRTEERLKTVKQPSETRTTERQ